MPRTKIFTLEELKQHRRDYQRKKRLRMKEEAAGAAGETEQAEPLGRQTTAGQEAMSRGREEGGTRLT